MSSIGPQLPPHLQPSKRKSPPSHSSSPPSKRVANENEIDLDDSGSDDDYGPKPSAPPAANKDEIGLESDSEDDMGPAPPGPAQPPADEDSSSEDDYGPSLPSASQRARIGPSLPPSTTEASEAPQRDDWMLAPPPSGPLSINDPSKISARSFSSKPSSKPQGGGASSIWTETPEEKLARLQASVLGKSEPPNSSSAAPTTVGKSKEDRAKERKMKENFDAARGKSMVEEARERRKKGGKEVDEEGDDDPSKRAFDREKDMAIGGSFSGKERREMMASAKDQSRFSKGTFL